MPMPTEKPLKFNNRKWRLYFPKREKDFYDEGCFRGEWNEPDYANDFWAGLEQPPAFTVRNFLRQFIHDYWECEFIEEDDAVIWACLLKYQASEN